MTTIASHSLTPHSRRPRGRFRATPRSAFSPRDVMFVLFRHKGKAVLTFVAIAAVVKEPHRVVSVTLSGLPPLNIWAFEGRRAIFYSHTPR